MSEPQELPRATLRAGADREIGPHTAEPAELKPLHRLYSPQQVAGAAFLGGPVGAAVVLALNERRLSSAGRAWLTLGLGVLGTIALIAIGLKLPDGVPAMILPIGSVFALREVARRLHGERYDRHLALGGPRGSNWAVVGAGIGALALTFGAIVGYIVVTDSYDKIVVNKIDVLYMDGGTEAEARAVGAVVTELVYPDPTIEASVVVRRSGTHHVVGFVMQDSAFTDLDIRNELQSFVEPLARRAFHGEPTEIWILDDTLETKVTIGP